LVTSCGAFSRTSNPTTADMTDSEQPDLADLANADAFQDLSSGSSNVSTRDQLTDDETPADLTPQPDQTDSEGRDQADAVDLESRVVVEPFPSGRPGAPITGRAQGPTAYDSQAASMSSPWAPFRSQLDWDVARWVNLRGRTSSAVMELLAIPGVCILDLIYCVSNLLVIGC